MMSPGLEPLWPGFSLLFFVALGQVICWRRGSLSTQAFAGQIDAGGVVDEPVQDGVGVGWIADKLVPVFDWHLAGH